MITLMYVPRLLHSWITVSVTPNVCSTTRFCLIVFYVEDHVEHSNYLYLKALSYITDPADDVIINS